MGNSVVIELSMDEAYTLVTMCEHVAGNMELSRRKHSDTILDGLYKAGIVADDAEYDDCIGTLTFNQL